MRHLRILQIGDVHFPQIQPPEAGIDVKDPKFPQHLLSAITPIPIQELAKAIRELMRAPPNLDAILFCGDLTSFGDMPRYHQCVNYLVKALGLDDHNRWPDHRIHVVVGNHDVDRTKIDRENPDLHRKFDEARSAWGRFRPGIVSPQALRSTNIENREAKARILSLNSCLGCGEWWSRLFSKAPRPELIEELDQYFGQVPTNEEALQRLDTPAFNHTEISEVLNSIRALEESSIPIVLAHHNLLPQATPRVDVYTDVINGGLARTLLARAGRPVLYLHGHIHDDPIEIVFHPPR